MSDEKGTVDFAFVPRSVHRDGKPATIKILKQRFERADGTSVWRDVPTRKPEELELRSGPETASLHQVIGEPFR